MLVGSGLGRSMGGGRRSIWRGGGGGVRRTIGTGLDVRLTTFRAWRCAGGGGAGILRPPPPPPPPGPGVIRYTSRTGEGSRTSWSVSLAVNNPSDVIRRKTRKPARCATPDAASPRPDRRAGGGGSVSGARSRPDARRSPRRRRTRWTASSRARNPRKAMPSLPASASRARATGTPAASAISLTENTSSLGVGSGLARMLCRLPVFSATARQDIKKT